MRRYYVIWHRIKTTGHCKLAVPLPFQKRVIKAVWKEKDLDIGYKLALADNGQKATLRSLKQGGMITFKLHLSIGLDQLGFQCHDQLQEKTPTFPLLVASQGKQ